MMTPAKRNSEWLPDVFNDFFNNSWMERANATEPAINVIENDKEYRVEVAAPGMEKGDFNIKVDNDNELVISMEKKSESHENGNHDNCDNRNNGNHDKDGHFAANEAHNGNANTNANGNANANGYKGNRDHYLRREFSYSKFQQAMLLPDDVEKNKISAKVNNGVLTINLPKQEPVKPQDSSRLISIE
jgi:HSP20 family protein